MTNIIISPSKYIQGKDEIHNVSKHTYFFGNKFLLLATENGIKRMKGIIEESFKGTDAKLTFETFNGECSRKEIQRIEKIVEEKGCDAVIGIGGGKTLDTAKAVAYYRKIPVVIIPTIASTDAPCSALSVIYTEKGEFSEYLILPKNPDIVLVDTAIIMKSPARFLIAGMGDALATYFEARASVRSNSDVMAGGKATKTAFAIAKLCYEILLSNGYKARIAAEKNVVTQAAQAVIEANTYLSGVGFESCGIAGAHSIHNGFTILHECHHLLHGEKVAFGTIAQLVLENSPIEEIEEVINFCTQVGLPTTLEKMGISDVKEEELMKVAELACGEGETIHNMPFKVEPQDVYAAILIADELGRQYIK